MVAKSCATKRMVETLRIIGRSPSVQVLDLQHQEPEPQNHGDSHGFGETSRCPQMWQSCVYWYFLGRQRPIHGFAFSWVVCLWSLLKDTHTQHIASRWSGWNPQPQCKFVKLFVDLSNVWGTCLTQPEKSKRQTNKQGSLFSSDLPPTQVRSAHEVRVGEEERSTTRGMCSDEAVLAGGLIVRRQSESPNHWSSNVLRNSKMGTGGVDQKL